MIVKNIRRLCAENGTNIKSIEKQLGIGNGAIAKWEQSTPRLDTIKKVADFFGVTVDELIREEAGNDA